MDTVAKKAPLNLMAYFTQSDSLSTASQSDVLAPSPSIPPSMNSSTSASHRNLVSSFTHSSFALTSPHLLLTVVHLSPVKPTNSALFVSKNYKHIG